MTYDVPKDITDMFDKLGAGAYSIMSAGLYDGAEQIANAVRSATPVDTGDLADALYIAPFEKTLSSVTTKIGFAGYDSKGTPNPLKAAALESGTSDGRISATHFFSKAVKSAKTKAENAIAFGFDKKLNEITKGK